MTEKLGPFDLGRVHHADCLEAMPLLPAESVQCCVTSPPYWGLRKYDVPDLVWHAGPAWPDGPPCEHLFGDDLPPSHPGPGNTRESALRSCGLTNPAYHADKPNTPRSSGAFCIRCGAWRGQLGLEPLPDLYVLHMVGILRDVRRVLRNDGTLWLNIGDCYATGAGAVGVCPGGGGQGKRWHGPTSQPNRMRIDGLKPKDLIGVPWAVAFALRADGWFLRAEIIWQKTAPMPESVRDRPTRAHEQVFLLSKAARYFYDHEAASDEAVNAGTVVSLKGKSLSCGQAAGAGKKPSGNGCADSVTVAARRNWRTVWTIGPEPNSAQHYAPFPRELARRCIVAGSKAGDVVLDPFAGTGTTVRVADGLQRKAIGFEIGETYVDQANERSGELRPADAKPGQQVGLALETVEA